MSTKAMPLQRVLDWWRLWFGCVALQVMGACYASSPPLTLVEDGQARCVIVLPPEPAKFEQIAADEIVHFLERISGARVPVATAGDAEPADSPVRILVGSAAVSAIDDLEVDRALDDRRDVLSCRDGFVLRVEDRAVALAGLRPTGTLYAAYELLERLGCRWYWPGELGQVVPKRTTIQIHPFETAQRPSFDLRSISFTGGIGLNRDAPQALDQWTRRNRTSLDYQWWAGHNIPQVALDDPKDVEKVAQMAMAAFEGSSEGAWYSLAWADANAKLPNDLAYDVQHLWDKRPQATDPLVRFYNRVIEKVETTFPNRHYGMLAYMNSLAPPFSVRPHRSLVPFIASIEQCPRHVPGSGQCWQRDALLQTVRGWCKLSDNVFIYDYEPGFVNIDGGVPVPSVTRMRHEYPQWHRAGLRGLYCQAQATAMNNGPNLYVRARLMWDIDADVGALLDDYFKGLFGPSARPTRDYWMALEQMVHNGPGHQHEDEIMTTIYPIDEVRRLETLVVEAEKRADSELIRRRLGAIQFSFDNLMLYLRMNEAEERAQFDRAAELARQIWALREKIEQTYPYFYRIGDLDRSSEDASFHCLGWARHNEGRHALTDGTKGELVAQLPDAWAFRTDPHNEGVVDRWYETDHDRRAWQRLRTCRVWEVQGHEDARGHGYDGVAWYHTRFNVPQRFASRNVMLNFGGVYGSMNIWVNGRFAAFRRFETPWWRNPYNEHFDVDLTDVIEAGKDHSIVIRVHNEFEWGGIYRRVFLYSPVGGRG